MSFFSDFKNDAVAFGGHLMDEINIFSGFKKDATNAQKIGWGTPLAILGLVSPSLLKLIPSFLSVLSPAAPWIYAAVAISILLKTTYETVKDPKFKNPFKSQPPLVIQNKDDNNIIDNTIKAHLTGSIKPSPNLNNQIDALAIAVVDLTKDVAELKERIPKITPPNINVPHGKEVPSEKDAPSEAPPKDSAAPHPSPFNK